MVALRHRSNCRKVLHKPNLTARYIAVDTETTGADLHHGCLPFTVSMMDDQGKEFLWQWEVNPRTRIPTIPERHKKQVRDTIKEYTPVFHNIKFDSRALSRIGIEPVWLSSSPEKSWEDTLIASHVLASEIPHGLKDLAWYFLDIDDADEQALRKAVNHARSVARNMNKQVLTDNPSAEPPYNLGPSTGYDYWLPAAINPDDDTLESYALLDAKRTILLWLNFNEVLDEEGLRDQYLREKRLLPVVYEMEERGITVSRSRIESEIKRYEERAEDHRTRCNIIAKRYGLKNFNPNSGKQLGFLLHDRMRIPVTTRTPSGQPATDAKTLKSYLSLPEIHGNAVRYLQHHLEATKDLTASKYLHNYLEAGIIHKGDEWQPVTFRIHPSLNQNGAKTTRFSHSSPNSANVGKGDEDQIDEDGKLIDEGDRKLRYVFGPSSERIWYSIDYQQLQLRIFAFAAQDQSMIDAFARGYNFHEFVASRIFNCEPEQVTKLQKRIGKNVNFGFIFGAGPARIEATAGMPGLWDTVTSQFPSAHSFMQQTIATTRRQGYVKTAGGYRLGVPADKAYIATNYYVQGTEGDIVKNAMIELKPYLAKHPGHYMVMQVHDELVFDFPRSTLPKHKSILKGIQRIMEKAGEDLGFITPVNIEVSTDNWAHAEVLKL